MGLAGGLVKRVFSKHRSPCGRDGNVDKSRWSLSKLGLCGDDYDSVCVEVNDLTSYECSELTTIHTLAGASETMVTFPSSGSSFKGPEDNDPEEVDGYADAKDNNSEIQNSEEKNQQEEYAALVIQSALKDFMARRKREQAEELGKCCEMETSSKVSQGTSVEVQAGDSVKNLSFPGESIGIPPRSSHKIKSRTPMIKEEWDDSTVSSNISKLRIQNKLEAMTRRERALAYAFSQQLRVCSVKKKQARHDLAEPSMSWTWLERWMATRRPEYSLSDCSSRHLPYIDHRPSILRKKVNVDLEESCGSNDVPVTCESSVIPTLNDIKDGYKAVKNRLKAPKETKRRNNIPSYNRISPPHKAIKSLREMEKEKQQKQMQAKAEGVQV